MDTNHDTSVVGEADGVAESPTEGQHVLKFEVQIYKARDGEYVVDFQVRVTEPLYCAISFMVLLLRRAYDWRMLVSRDSCVINQSIDPMPYSEAAL